MEIRLMEEDDIEQVMDRLLRLKRLNAEFDKSFLVSVESEDEIKNYIKKILKDENHVLLVADDNGKIAGILMVDILFRIYYYPKYEARIREFYIMPEYRNNNLGRNMISKLTEILKNKNINFITAEFPTMNTIAANFYEKLGYHQLVSVYSMIKK
ncbi:GNAT family N-acetyltransferase [Picrophilus oshimae]|nr:GNAT family N-acetyltransferase [Picrophilus oshimae]